MSEFSLQARRRTAVVMGVLFFMAAALVARLVDLQVISRGQLGSKASDVVVHEAPLRARRGHITDAVGRALALNEKGTEMWVDTEVFKANSAAAIRAFNSMCGLLDSDTKAAIVTGTYVEDNPDRTFVRCSPSLTTEEVAALTEMVSSDDPDGKPELTGIYTQTEPLRIYPYASLVAPVIGFLVPDSSPAYAETVVYRAIGGVEEYHDAELRGADGSVLMERDARGYAIPIGKSEESPALEGANLTLTLDLNIQYMAEQLLNAAIKDAGARRGDIIVMDPRTGAILAMVTSPTFDPVDLDACKGNPICEPVIYRNPIIGLHYEPGSTMKIVTMAIALEAGVVYPGWSFECNGTAYVGPAYFHNWDYGSHGHETLDEILLHSCNVGAVTVAQMIPSETYYSYLDRLSFGKLTGIDILGELSGTLRTPDDELWSVTDQATNAFGQSIAVTPIQLAAAVSTVANGGTYYEPYITQAIEQGGTVTTTLPTIRTQVFHREICQEVTDMLVAAGNTKGKNGGPLLPGYRVALKTGTAQIPIEGGAGYEEHRTIASAIGYAPAEDPRFLILVRIEGESVIYGEAVAVPVLGNLASAILAYMRIPPMGEAAAVP